MERRHGGRPRWAALMAAVLLSACGGGEEPTSAEPSAEREAPASFFPPGSIPGNAHLMGMWSPVYNWPLIAVHAVLMPDGRVLSYGTNSDGRQTGRFIYDLWDGAGAPDAGHATLSNTSGTDLFCSSQLLLPNGNGAVFIAGGDNWTGTATTNTGNNNSNVVSAAGGVTRGPNMFRPRWYSTSTTLINGETYIQGGSGGGDRAEVRQVDGSFRLLSPSTSSLQVLYPRNFIAPNGQVFGYDSAGRMYYMDATGNGRLTLLGQLPAANRGDDASAAMYRPGRILQFGGSSNGAVVIDINGASPVVTATQSMSSQRRLVNATLLADGKVLATGGSRVWNELIDVNNRAEIWDPQTGSWTVGSAGSRARLYHSNALLMPDASVLVMGGGAPGPQNNTNVEVYYPPYLFTAGGQRAARPSIVHAPNEIEIGETFPVDVLSGASVRRVTLVKTGSTTHSFNMEQRFQDLDFQVSGNRLSVQAPTRAAFATPGYYMIFVIDEAGVPSMASVARIGVAADPNPALTPQLLTPSAQTATVGYAASLQLSASDPNGDSLEYRATGLPPGLTLDEQSGRISGIATEAGSYDVGITVSDGVNATSVHFLWTVVLPQPLAFGTVPAPTPVSTSGPVSYTAQASGQNVRYSWNFGDGSPATAWSSSATGSHQYAAPGTFSVTVSITDDSGFVQSRSFLQIVYLPATSGRPGQSGNLLVETPASGNARIWVVNQDNDSVTAFDAVTRARLAEVPVGVAPRSIARAANGQIWVTNLRSASISVIDPATRSVLRTIALPRASRPYGIVMSPNGQRAYVVLEATGSLLEFNTASGSTPLRSLSVDENARHVSMRADGARLYVTRFITPPLPGESTAQVAPTASTGGEVLEVDLSSFSVARRIVLRHSDLPDFENQGRGIPNYLGAAAISPDGSQAWVPSKQDNVKRGTRRDGNPLNFQSTVRAISSRIVLASGTEDLALRIDHDNASLASAATYDSRGVYLFVALETSREVAVIDAHGGFQLMRFEVGRAPQGLALGADGLTLYVNNFMDRTVGVYDLRPLVQRGEASVPRLADLAAVGSDALPAQVLRGKQFFYDARDTRLARDAYMSCASCHNDGGHDGRTWDFTHSGEGLRNTISLRGRAGAQGLLHWSANFDEVQDFEGQIRALAGGAGMMSDADYFAGTRAQPLGLTKAGFSADLDALAAYVSSLSGFEPSPHRSDDGNLTAEAAAGRAVFEQKNCASCHGGANFTRSGELAPQDIGTIKPTSGSRLGGTLSGIDVPTLRDVWATAPYLHDGSAPTLQAAVSAHQGIPSLSSTELAQVGAYLRQIGSDEAHAPQASGGLRGEYFANGTLSGAPVLTRQEAVNFDWGASAPGPGVPADNFSARWSGQVIAQVTGSHVFRTQSDNGVRVWINNVLVIDHWTEHGPTVDVAAPLRLVAGEGASIRVEFHERWGGAQMRLEWQPPGATAFVAVPEDRLDPREGSQPVGNGLLGEYFANATLSGSPVASDIGAVDFDWGSGSPAAGVPVDLFSARWSGHLVAPASGVYRFQTVSDNGVRLRLGADTLIDNWVSHPLATDTSVEVSLLAGQRYPVQLEYYENWGGAQVRLRWQPPGSPSFVPVPATQLESD